MDFVCVFSDIWFVNGLMGDLVFYVDYFGVDDGLLFDVGENDWFLMLCFVDFGVVFIIYYYVDYFIGFDWIVCVNIDSDKIFWVFGFVGIIEKVYSCIVVYEYFFFLF